MPPAPHKRPLSPSQNRDATGAAADEGQRCDVLVAPTEEAIGGDEGVQVEGGCGEIEPITHAVDPGTFAAVQVEEHRKTHMPFRSWCKWCVLGRGRGLQHRRSGTSSVPIMCMDYFFPAKGGVRTREEL